ncbi:hypothetical protein [Flagellimonas marinaquae]|uniref:hypothetical protein n=1 Tax=Flagellimonas marinaquae TaxID=254955 RepID=UPI0020765E43|nr:hypothetical protein [Allomuricauda aquimarina]USD26889.1 hypothetical protein MJO53_08320 [Allomuricauda aquimarina]
MKYLITKKLFAADDETPIKLVKDDNEVTKLENITINDTGKAIVKVKLRPKSDEDYKKLKEKFKDDKVAKLFLKVTCQGDDKNHENEFLTSGELEVKKSKRAPWMEYAEEEFKTYKGINENKSPLKERIEEYFNTTNAKTGKHNTPWCGAFVNWCFEQTDEYKGTNTGLNALAFDWGSKGNSKAKASKHKPDGWANGEECDPFYWAVIVLNYSHTAFIVGENSKKNKYVYLGGNQGGSGSGTQKIQYGSVIIGKEFMIMKPKDYNVSEGEKSLKEYNVNKDGSYETTR